VHQLSCTAVHRQWPGNNNASARLKIETTEKLASAARSTVSSHRQSAIPSWNAVLRYGTKYALPSRAILYSTVLKRSRSPSSEIQRRVYRVLLVLCRHVVHRDTASNPKIWLLPSSRGMLRSVLDGKENGMECQCRRQCQCQCQCQCQYQTGNNAILYCTVLYCTVHRERERDKGQGKREEGKGKMTRKRTRKRKSKRKQKDRHSRFSLLAASLISTSQR
jgi:hypothetical protein